MDRGTGDEYRFLARLERDFAAGTADRVLAELARLGDSMTGYRVTRLEHSLQTASRAKRDGADEPTVVAALVHDIGDGLAPYNHGEFAAAILKPYVTEAIHWLVAHHGVFQGYYFFHHLGADRDLRERYRGHPHFEATAAFCQNWDQLSFDPAYDTMPLEAFEPLVRRVLAQPRFEAERV